MVGLSCARDSISDSYIVNGLLVNSSWLAKCNLRCSGGRAAGDSVSKVEETYT